MSGFKLGNSPSMWSRTGPRAVPCSAYTPTNLAERLFEHGIAYTGFDLETS